MASTFSRDAAALAAKDAEIRRQERMRSELRESLSDRGAVFEKRDKQADPRVRDAADQFAGGRLQEVVRGGRTRGSSAGRADVLAP